MKNCKPLPLAVQILIFAMLFAESCSSPAQKSTETFGAGDTSQIETESVNRPWQYSEEVDRMTSIKIYTAKVVSNVLLQFDFPYDGGTTVTFYLRNKNGKNEAFLSISRGLFLTKFDEPRSYRVRFDDQPSTYYSFVSPANGDAKLTFVQNPNQFIRHLKTAKMVRVELEFYREGFHMIEFEVANLKWNH